MRSSKSKIQQHTNLPYSIYYKLAIQHNRDIVISLPATLIIQPNDTHMQMNMNENRRILCPLSYSQKSIPFYDNILAAVK